MNVQYVRLDDETCEMVNRLAREQRRTVSDLVNEILREKLRGAPAQAAGESSAQG